MNYRQRLAEMLLRQNKSAPARDHPANPDLSHHYDPNQPRVPAGHSDGGRWTRGGGGMGSSTPQIAPNRTVTHDQTGEEAWKTVITNRRPDGSIAEHLVINRDGSAIHSQYAAPGTTRCDERHTVITPDKQIVTFENSGLTQAVYDAHGQQLSQTVLTMSGPEPQAFVQPAYAQFAPYGWHLLQKTIEAAAILYAWYLSQDGPNQKAVIAFKAHKYEVVGKGTPEAQAVWVGQLTQQEVKDACERYRIAQRITNKATTEVRADGGYRDEAIWNEGASKNRARGQERGRSQLQGRGIAREDARRGPACTEGRSGQKAEAGSHHSIRLDLLDHNGQGTVCVYDVKTGKRRMYKPRFHEIAASVFHHFKNATSFIVVEMRPYQ
jgi:hypothetical protein